MIINHKYKFIFIKTRKTAGTSIEVALSRFCDSNDIITPISPEDEIVRKKLGYTGPKNYIFQKKSLNHPNNTNKNMVKFYNHVSTLFIKNNIPEEIWNTYFKFCFERNPFDRIISRFYWRLNHYGEKINIEDFIRASPQRLLSNWDLYTIENDIVVDFVGKYENLNNNFNFVANELGLPGNIKLPKLKSDYRLDRRHYSMVLGKAERKMIEKACFREIDAFSYHWEDSIKE